MATDPNDPLAAQPRLTVEYLPLDALTLDPENARLHKPAQIKQIAKSIQAFAFNAPILVDRDAKVIAGHGRVLACRHLGWSEVPVVRLDHLTPAQARAFAIADNRLAETSSWDEKVLAGHFKILAELDLDFSLEATGFSIGEIDLKIEGLDVGEDDAPDPDEAEILQGPAVAQSGDLWTLGRHSVLCGDALAPESYARLMDGALADMVFADPPYNVRIEGHVSGKGKHHHREFAMAAGEMSEAQFTDFLTTACQHMADASADGALNFICMDWAHLYPLQTAGRAVYDGFINLCVWAKANGGMGGLYRSAHELVLVFKKGRTAHRNNVQLGKFGRNRTNVWSYPGGGGFGRGEEADLTAQHPTPKPVAMIADAMLDVTERGDLVLDPFLGSGSTLMAAERVGRVCRGIEMDPLYVDLTIRRWQRLTGDVAVRQDGVTFNALATPDLAAAA
jgi:DNA modification methylase